tara:strand:+ start:386 stop:1051 length:666 start_codon:yes stop_codon:yes gene_type:complete
MNKTDIDILTKWVMTEYIGKISDDDKNCDKRNIREKCLNLPFAEIDGVRIENAYISMKKHYMWFEIKVRNLDECYAHEFVKGCCIYNKYRILYCEYPNVWESLETAPCFTKFAIREGMKMLIEIITNLRYEPKNGELTTKNKSKAPSKQLKLLTSLNNCKTTKINECCVCYDETFTSFRKCNHNVCCRCISNMPRKYKCPMCRERISYMDTDDEFDDTDDE